MDKDKGKKVSEVSSIALNDQPLSVVLTPIQSNPLYQPSDAMDTSVGTAVTRITTDKTRTQSDAEIQQQARNTLQRLLPRYKEKFYARLKPLQHRTNALTLSDFQAACQIRKQFMPLLLWLKPKEAQAADRDFQQACINRQSDILAQIRTLATSSQPTLVQQQALQAWLQTIHNLLTQWGEAGYHTWVRHWQTVLHQQLPSTVIVADIPLPEDNGLALLAKGLATPLTTPDIPAAWEQAHEAALQCLTRYAIQGQWSAFLHAKRRYTIRLRSYQLFCEQLSTTHPDYALLGAWCQSHLSTLRSLPPAALMTTQSPPSPGLWQKRQDFDEKQTPLALLPSLCTHLVQQLILPTPCMFEVILMQSSKITTDWRLHILVANSLHCQDEYFVVYQQLLELYAMFLPTEHVSVITVNLATPQNLAGLYCPLLPSQTETTVPTYLPRWQQQYPNPTPTSDKPEQPLWIAFIRHLMQHLTQVVSQGQAEEKAIRQQHHALATQPLIETKERAVKLKDSSLTDSVVMLEKTSTGASYYS